MTFGPILGEQSQVIEQAFSSVWNSQRIRVGLFETRRPMRPFAKWPLPGLLKPELPKKILVEWAVKEVTERVVFGRDQPILPNRDTAIAVGIDVAIGVSRNSATDLENARLATGKKIGQLHFDVEFGERPGRCGNDTFLEYEISALDMDRLIACRSVKLRLVKANRPSDFLQREQFRGPVTISPKAWIAIP